MYWVIRKVLVDFEGKLNAKDLNFLFHLLNLNLLRHELSGQPNIYYMCIYYNIRNFVR